LEVGHVLLSSIICNSIFILNNKSQHFVNANTINNRTEDRQLETVTTFKNQKKDNDCTGILQCPGKMLQMSCQMLQTSQNPAKILQIPIKTEWLVRLSSRVIHLPLLAVSAVGISSVSATGSGCSQTGSLRNPYRK